MPVVRSSTHTSRRGKPSLWAKTNASLISLIAWNGSRCAVMLAPHSVDTSSIKSLCSASQLWPVVRFHCFSSFLRRFLHCALRTWCRERGCEREGGWNKRLMKRCKEAGTCKVGSKSHAQYLHDAVLALIVCCAPRSRRPVCVDEGDRKQALISKGKRDCSFVHVQYF